MLYVHNPPPSSFSYYLAIKNKNEKILAPNMSESLGFNPQLKITCVSVRCKHLIQPTKWAIYIIHDNDACHISIKDWNLRPQT